MTLLEHVPADEYHRRVLGEANKSGLDEVHRCGARYKAWIEQGLSEDTPALRFGSAFHAHNLEPDIFAADYAIEPDFGDCRRKDNKAARDAWRADNAGRQWVSAEDGAKLAGMRAALLAHPYARKLLEMPGEVEGTARWTDPATGLQCKARVDKLSPQVPIAWDLKSAEDASPNGFAGSVARYRYHVQAAHYLAGLDALGIEAQWAFVVVEKTPPYLVGVYTLGVDDLELGRRIWRGDMQRLAECVERDEWPGYGDGGITEISLPMWAYREE